MANAKLMTSRTARRPDDTITGQPAQAATATATTQRTPAASAPVSTPVLNAAKKTQGARRASGYTQEAPGIQSPTLLIAQNPNTQTQMPQPLTGDDLYQQRHAQEAEAKKNYWENILLLTTAGASGMGGQQDIADYAQNARDAYTQHRELSQATEWDGRQELIDEYRKLSRQGAFAPGMSPANRERQARMEEIRQQLEAGDQAAGNGVRSYSWQDRVRNTAGGTAQNIGAGLTNAFATQSEVYGNALTEQIANDPNMIRYLERTNQDADAYTRMIREAGSSLHEDLKPVYDAADRLGGSAAEDLQKAKEGLGVLGQAGVDIAENLIEMGFDAAVGAATGGGSLIPMAFRTFGGAAQEARQAGASLSEQYLYGLSKAAIETATEKIADGVAGIYGRGAADDITEELIRKLAETDTGRSMLRVMFGAISEGNEEVLSDLLSPLADAIYKDESIGQLYRQLDPADMLHSFLMGAAVGGLTGGAGAVLGSNRAANAELRARDAQEAMPQTPSEAMARVLSAQQNRLDAQQTANEEFNAAEAAQSNAQQPGQQETRLEAETPQETPSAISPVQSSLDIANAFAANPTAETAGSMTQDYEAMQEEFQRRMEAFNNATSVEEAQGMMPWLQAAQEYLGSHEQEYYRAQGVSRVNRGQVSKAYGTEENFITNRNYRDVGKLNVKAFQFDHPELHPYFQSMAEQIADEIGVQAGATITTYSNRTGNFYTLPVTHPYLRTLMRYNMTKAEADGALENIMKDQGKDNYADAKRAELFLHDCMINGYTTPSGKQIPPNQEYINALSQIPGGAEIIWKAQREQYENSFYFPGNEKSEEEIEAEMQKWDAEHPNPASQNNAVGGVVPTAQDDSAPTGMTAQGPALLNGPADRASNVPQDYEESNIQNPMVQALLQNESGQAETESIEPPAPGAPLPPSDSGVNGGNGPTLGTVRSQAEANTIQAIDERVDAPEGVRNPLYYNPQSEAESMAKARDYLENGYTSIGGAAANSKLTAEQSAAIQAAGQRLGGGYAQAMADMQGAAAWTSVQQDMSTLVLEALAKDAQGTGNWDAYEAWRIVDQEHATEIARTLQARGKNSRGTTHDILGYVSEVISGANLSKEARDAALTKTMQYAEEFKATDKEDADALRDLIERISKERGTGTIIRGRLRKLLANQDAAYLAKVAEAQCKALANDYIPSSVGDKIKSYQTIAQLLKFTTFARNIGGNATFGFMDALVGDTFGVALDRAVSSQTGARAVGFDTRWLNSTQRKAAVDAMNKSMLEIALDVDMNSVGTKYDPRGRSYRMSGNAAERFMSRLSQILSYSLTSSDAFFRGGIEAGTTETLTRLNAGNEAALSQVENVAENRADYMLFQNNGKAAQTAKAFHDRMNAWLGVGGKVENGKRSGGFGLGDVIMPYATVPANLAVKAFEYSPAGIVRGGIEMAQVMKDAKNGKLDLQKQHNAVMDIARGVTGLPVALLFSALIRKGIIKRGDDEKDYDVTKARQSENRKETQWNVDATLRWLSGGSSDWQEGDSLVSLNWMEPLNAFMDIGSLLADAQEDGDPTVLDYMKSYAVGSVQAAMEMPMIDSLQSAIQAMQYADSDNMFEKLGKFGESTLTSAATGMIPGLASQIGRVIDPTTRDTSGDTFTERFANAIMNATPGLREQLPEKLDSFGQPITNNNPLLNALNNLVLPGTILEYAPNDVVQALDEVYQATGNSNFFPDYKAPASFDYDGNSYALTAEEKRTYQESFGQRYNELVQGVIDNKIYDSMTDAERAVVFGKMRSIAISEARGEIVKARGGKYESDYDKIRQLSDIPGYYAMQAMYSSATKDEENRDYERIPQILRAYANLPEDVREQLNTSGSVTARLDNLYEAYRGGVSAQNYFTMTDTLDGLTPAQGYAAVAGWQKLEAIGQSNLSMEDRDFFATQQLEGSSVDKYLACREVNYRPQDIAAFYRIFNTTTGDDRNGDGKADSGTKKRNVIAAAMEYGFSQKQATELYNMWQKGTWR